jgi:hypothetical protein
MHRCALTWAGWSWLRLSECNPDGQLSVTLALELAACAILCVVLLVRTGARVTGTFDTVFPPYTAQVEAAELAAAARAKKSKAQ